MLAHIRTAKFLKDSLGCKQFFLRSLPVITSRWNSYGFFTSSKRSYHGSIPPHQSSVFRSLLGLTVVVGGVSTAIYLNPTARDYLEDEVPQLKHLFAQFDNYVSNGQNMITQFKLPSLPAIFNRDASIHPIISDSKLESFNTEISPPTNYSLSSSFNPSTRKDQSVDEVNLDPSFPSFADIQKKVSQTPEIFKATQDELNSIISNTDRSVQEALADLRHLEMVTKRHLEDLQALSSKWSFPKLSDKVESAQLKAISSHHNAQQNLSQLRASLDAVKASSMSPQQTEVVKRAINRYGDLGYQLSGLVNEVRRLQNQVAAVVNFNISNSTDNQKVRQEVNSILPKTASGKHVSQEAGNDMGKNELNSLLSMALERIDQLSDNLASGAVQAKRRLFTALQAHHQVAERLIRDEVEREIAKMQIQHEIDRFEWEKEAAQQTEHELNASLARHGHHLAQMLRLKQEELEHKYSFRLREALVAQKEQIEGELAKWIQRMAAIEHVVDGRVDIERIAKESQALWLAVEALAFALDTPSYKAGALSRTAGQIESKSFYTSEPLLPLVEAVKKAAGTSIDGPDFPQHVIDSLPAEALSQGVCTRQGLLHRFNKVYQVSCNVAMVPETSDSLWGYFVSWLQSKLLFDRLGRRRILSHLSGGTPALITPETILPDGNESSPDAFILLASAKAALMPETDVGVNVNPINSADLKFAVRLLGQLKGQSAVVASDWLRDARRFLEVHQAVQALLAYARAQNFSAFEKRI